MHIERHTVDVTTDSSGNAEVYTDKIVTGRVLAAHYLKDGDTPFDDGVDVDITVATTGEVVLSKDDVNASASFYPRVEMQDSGGNTLQYDDSQTGREPIPVANDRLKIAIAQGGNAKNGQFVILVG